MIQKITSSVDKQFLAVIALFGVALSWGTTFVIVADAVSGYPVYAFLALRFIVASLAFVAIFPKVIKLLNRDNLVFGLGAGVLLSLGYIFQTVGLLPAEMGGTSPARTAFLTGMYVVIVPVVQAFMAKQLPRKTTILGVVLALMGLWAFAGISFDDGLVWARGDTYVLISAFAYSAHMLFLGLADNRHSSLAVTFVQLLVVAMVTGSMSIATGEHAGLPTTFNVWFAVLVTGIIASAFAFAVQTWSQKVLPASRVALILISEPAIGGIVGWWVAQSAPRHEVIGAALMLSGMIASESLRKYADDRKQRRLKRAVVGMPIYVDHVDQDPSCYCETDEDDLASGD